MGYPFHRLLSGLKRYFIKEQLKRNNIKFDTVPTFSDPWLKINNEGKIWMGAHCSFRSFRLRQYLTVLKNAELETGEGSFINDGVNLCAA